MSRRVLRISSIINSKQRDIFNRYVPGSGVGACNVSVRRAKLIKATRTSFVPEVPPPPPSLCGSMQFNALTGTDCVYYPNNNSLVIGSNDFTIEWWQYWTGEAPYPRPFSIGTYPNAEIAVSYEDSIYFWYNGNYKVILQDPPPLNTWTHIALVGSGGTEVRLYIDGIEQSTTSINYNFTDGTTPLTIGNQNISTNEENFKGKITNFRWVVGTQVYTSNFSPPITPLTNISGTRLLLLAAGEVNVIADSSSYNRIPINNGVIYSTITPLISCSALGNLIYSKNNTTSGGYVVGGPVTKDMTNNVYTTAFIPSDYSEQLFPDMFSLNDENIVQGNKTPEDRLDASYWLDLGNNIFDNWGFFYIYDVGSGKYFLPLIDPQNQADGIITTQTINAFGRTFIINQGWPVQGIFKIEISVNDDLNFKFGGYGNMGSDGNQYVENLIYNYTLGGNNLKLYYHLDQQDSSNIEKLYSYWIPKKVSENDNIPAYDVYYTNSDYMSSISKNVSRGLIVYFSKTNDVKEWVVNDLELQ